MNYDAKSSLHMIVKRLIDMTIFSQSPSTIAPSFPNHVHIEPTNTCSLRCIHCVQESMTRKRGLMDYDVYTKIIDEIGPKKCSITLDVQGEPLLHPRALDMIAYAKKKGCHVSLLTNGVRLTEERSRVLVDLGLDRIVFSFDAVEKALYEAIRCRSSFEKNLFNILTFLRTNLEAGRPVFVCMSIINQAATKDHISQFKSYFSELPVDTMFVSELLNMSGYSSVSNEIDLQELKEKADGTPICRVPWENLTVNWSGDVCPCPLDFNVLWSAGNVKDHSLEEIWNSDVYKEFRQRHMDGDLIGLDKDAKLCSTCNCRYDPEYDLRRYKEFATQTILRKSEQFARSLAEEQGDDARQQKEFPLLDQRLAELGAALDQMKTGNR